MPDGHRREHRAARQNQRESCRPEERRQIPARRLPSGQRRDAVRLVAVDRRDGFASHSTRRTAAADRLPHFHFRKIASSRPSLHGLFQDPVDSIAKHLVPWREHADVVRHRNRLGVRDETRRRSAPPLGEHVVEQHRVEPADQQIRIRMHVIVVGHGDECRARVRRRAEFRRRSCRRACRPAARAGRPAYEIARASAERTLSTSRN